MSDDFGTAAGRLAGFCCLRFGWAPDQFWAATPAEVAALVAVLLPGGEAPVTADELRRLEGDHG